MEEYHLIPDPAGTILYDPETIAFYRLTSEGEKALRSGLLHYRCSLPGRNRIGKIYPSLLLLNLWND